METAEVQIWTVRNSAPYKIGVVELENMVVKDRDVSFLTVYNQSFLRISVHGEDDECALLRELHLYCILNDQVTISV